jgi:hypothetical protein
MQFLGANRAQKKRYFFELNSLFDEIYGSGKRAESGSGADMPDEQPL